jgi:4-diphosphocytidyl-2-C-methyl-D-erythritol kinase
LPPAPRQIQFLGMNCPSEKFVPVSRPAWERTSAGLRAWAPAKINLNLLVGPCRGDGFHPLDSLVAKITLYDQIDLSPRSDGRVVFSCNSTDCGSDEKNLALRAGLLLAEAAKNRPGLGANACGADIALIKNIPPGKGLGGGSSDAASVLAGLNELWQLGLAKDELAGLGATLGSDVPLFFGGTFSRMTGRGEFVRPIALPDFYAVLCLPQLATSTAAVYHAFDALANQGGIGMGKSSLILDNDNPPAGRPSAWRELLRNDLLPPALRVCPGLAEIMQALAQADPTVCLTGSGSAMFILCDDQAQAYRTLANIAPQVAAMCMIVRSQPA